MLPLGESPIMLYPFFALAARSPTRQRTFRRLLLLHLLLLMGGCWMLSRQPVGRPAVLLGHLALVAGIIEGALLMGWRLTQLPRSQALEFLLVSPLRPAWFLLAEALVGLAQLALLTLAGLPVLVLLVADGQLDPLDPAALLLVPWTWGAITGLGLTVWAFEPRGVRRWGERIVLGLVLLYLVVGVLAAEKLRHWLERLPEDVSVVLLRRSAYAQPIRRDAVLAGKSRRHRQRARGGTASRVASHAGAAGGAGRAAVAGALPRASL
jgi:hypothetical protein